MGHLHKLWGYVVFVRGREWVILGNSFLLWYHGRVRWVPFIFKFEGEMRLEEGRSRLSEGRIEGGVNGVIFIINAARAHFSE